MKDQKGLFNVYGISDYCIDSYVSGADFHTGFLLKVLSFLQNVQIVHTFAPLSLQVGLSNSFVSLTTLATSGLNPDHVTEARGLA